MAKTEPKPRVLIVDDEEYFVRSITDLLESEGFEVESTAHGRRGMDLLKQETFNLAVIDYQLPDMEGVDLLEWMRREAIETPCLMVTGYASVDVAVRAMKSGAVDFFTKPVEDLQAFLRAIHMQVEANRTCHEDRRIPSVPESFDVESVRELCRRFDPPIELSRRQYEVATALLQGCSNKEIAAQLYISEKTVKNHLTEIYRKFGVAGRGPFFNRVLRRYSE